MPGISPDAPGKIVAGAGGSWRRFFSRRAYRLGVACPLREIAGPLFVKRRIGARFSSA